ncbi:hypothetical protein GCM10028801_08750 [Nocardioides maradonensis]
MTQRVALSLGAAAVVAAGTATAAHATAVTGSVSDPANDYTTDYTYGAPPSTMPAKSIDLYKTTIRVSSTRIYGTVTISHISSSSGTVGTGEDMEFRIYNGAGSQIGWISKADWGTWYSGNSVTRTNCGTPSVSTNLDTDTWSFSISKSCLPRATYYKAATYMELNYRNNTVARDHTAKTTSAHL